ncbi:MAG: NAD(+)/NADH kinase [Planctomycetota bacterium]|jgi:NAD+ kinase
MGQPKLILFGDPKRPNAAEAVKTFVAFAETKAEILANCFESGCDVDILQQADYAVVFGGDGTILGAARQLCESKVPVIGVNAGKLGFLAEFSIEELIEQFDRIISGQMLIENRMIVQCAISRNGQEVFTSTAVNDAVVSAGAPFNMIEMKLAVAGEKLAVCISDGLILSTPTGSTAYNLSSGGPIVSANLSAMVITPMCPHSLSFRPIVIKADNEVSIEMVRINEQTTLLLDGQVQKQLQLGDIVKVRQHPGQFQVVNNPLRTQWETLASKLNWAQKPRYNNQSKSKE